MVTNLCPASGGNIPWCSMPTNQYGYAAHFDIMAKGSLASGWGEFSHFFLTLVDMMGGWEGEVMIADYEGACR